MNEDVLSAKTDVKPEGYYAGQRSEMLAFVPSSVKTVLEVGCGSGVFAAQIKQLHEAEVWGVEPNKESAEVASEVLDRVFCEYYNSAVSIPSSYFDCVVFNDVLEHFVEPMDALKLAKSHLKTGGVVIASIPNVRYFPVVWDLLVAKQWKYTDFGVLDRTHLRFFTEESIRDIFLDLGFQILTLQGINSLRGHKKYNLARMVLGSRIEDMRYLQFAVVARPL